MAQVYDKSQLSTVYDCQWVDTVEGVSNFSMQSVDRSSEIACCTNSGSVKLDRLLGKKLLGGGETKGSL